MACGRANPKSSIPDFVGAIPERGEDIDYDTPCFLPTKELKPLLVYQCYCYRYVFECSAKNFKKNYVSVNSSVRKSVCTCNFACTHKLTCKHIDNASLYSWTYLIDRLIEW